MQMLAPKDFRDANFPTAGVASPGGEVDSRAPVTGYAFPESLVAAGIALAWAEPVFIFGALCRGVAQLGSALRSGRRGRWFKSSHPDHYSLHQIRNGWRVSLRKRRTGPDTSRKTKPAVILGHPFQQKSN